MQYQKPTLSITEQMQLLQMRGLQCVDSAKLEQALMQIGYSRLSAYFLPYKLPHTDPASNKRHFIAGTTFEQVIALYQFDSQLRLLVMEAMEQIEIVLRTRWAHEMAIRHGPHAYMNRDLFKCPWQHTNDLARIADHLKASNESFVQHYRTHYRQPFLPPIWAVVETMSLGGLSRWFSASNDIDAKRVISKYFGMPTIDILEQVLHVLTPVRNICAHHARLWNRRFTLQLPLIKRLKNEMVITTQLTAGGQSQQQLAREIFNYLTVIAHILRRIDVNSTWQARVGLHVQSATPGQQMAMGFTPGWMSRPGWQMNPMPSQA